MKRDTLITAILVACGVITTSLVVRREFLPAVPLRPVEQKPVLILDWQQYLAAGYRVGPQHAEVHIIEFADFECPFCGNFHQMLKSTKAKYPKQIELEYVHFPLQGHRFAMPAAAGVAECAREQGRFEAMR